MENFLKAVFCKLKSRNICLNRTFPRELVKSKSYYVIIRTISSSIGSSNMSIELTYNSDQIFLNGDNSLPVTPILTIHDTLKADKWPVYRILGIKGNVIEGATEPIITESLCLKMYSMLVRIQVLDEIFYNAQRQGRISFYMQSSGEEATHIGSAAALSYSDMVLAQYREVGLLLWRGFSLQDVADQCFSNVADLGKGRQMPIHYGSRELNYQTISSPLATQMPQAVGVAYAMKLSNSQSVAICFFGEGAASEGDFHAAMNFASTLEAPVIFFCRNNGYAISTPAVEQYRGDGIVSRASGYGMHCIRVDGNDILAIYTATEQARKIALDRNCPVLIEAMTYRRGHHSTSDDSTKYRSLSEINFWRDHFDPVSRFRNYLESKGWWDPTKEQTLRESERTIVVQAMQIAEKKPKPELDSMFEDVYKEKPPNLIKQEKELLKHIAKFPDHYNNSNH